LIELDERFVDVHVRRYIKYMKDNHLKFEIFKNGQLMSDHELNLFV
jgi:hypothetical protein